MQYTRLNTIDKILKMLPDFKPRWNKHLQEWDDSTGDRTIHSDIHIFYEFISEKIKKDKKYKYKLAFEILEELLVDGDDEVSESIAMMFLESIITTSAHGHYSVDSFFPYLGIESKKFCKANEQFWGIENSKCYEDK